MRLIPAGAIQRADGDIRPCQGPFGGSRMKTWSRVALQSLLTPDAKEGVEMSRDILDDTAADSDANVPATRERFTRQRAIKQIERRRRFWASTVTAGIGMIVLVAIWATTEYHNAGGWPTGGFSQSSGIPNVWNFWIIYPFLAWVLLSAASAWFVYGRRPISESEIKRE